MKKEFEDYLLYLKNVKKYSEKTISSYFFDLKDFSVYLNDNNINIDECVYQDIQDYMNSLKIKNYKATSINRKIVCLRSFYKYYVNEVDEKCKNPLIAYKNLKTPVRLPKDLFKQQVKALLIPCEKKDKYIIRNQCIILLLLNTGMRVSEICNLDLLDIDLNETVIRVLGKGKKERMVFFMPSVIPYLNQYLSIRNDLLLDKNDQALFIGSKGTRITSRAIQMMLNDRASKANPPFKVTPHMLRHTFATNLLNNDVDLKIVQDLLGHSSLSTTQIYTHVSKARLQKVYSESHPMAKALNKINEEKEK